MLTSASKSPAGISPPEISAMILQKLKTVAEDYLGQS
jgi:molecular chaperone DnaK (HSP70)